MLRRLALGASLTFTANALYAASQWIALVLVARYIDSLGAGQFAIALAISGPVILFANLQLAGLLATDAHDSFPFATYLGLRLLMVAVAFVAIAVIGWLAVPGGSPVRVVWIVGASKCCEAVSDLFYGALLRIGRFSKLAAAVMTNSLLSLGLFALLLITTRNIAAAAFGWLLGSIVTLIGINARYAVEGTLPGIAWPSRHSIDLLVSGLFSSNRLWKLLKLAAPLGAVSALLSVQANAPQYVIQYVLGPSDVGRYAVLAYPFFLGNLVVTAMGQASAGQFADSLKSKNRPAYRHVLLTNVIVGGMLGAGAIGTAYFFGARLLAMVYGYEYSKYQSLFVLLSVAAGVRYGFLPVGVAVTAERRIAVQVVLRLAVLLCVFAGCAIGAWRAGLTGVGYALLGIAVAEGAIWAVLGVSSVRRSVQPERSAVLLPL